jgi:hypothetical protein
VQCFTGTQGVFAATFDIRPVGDAGREWLEFGFEDFHPSDSQFEFAVGFLQPRLEVASGVSHD